MRQRDAYRVYLILQGAFSLCFATIATTNLVYQAQTARLNPLQLVLVGTVLEATSFVCQVPTGVLADRYSRRAAVIAGYALTGAGFVLEGAIPRFETILLAQVIWGAGITLTDGAQEAWIAGEVGEERLGHVFLRSTQVAEVAGLAGVAISVALASVRLNLPLVVGGVAIVALAGYLALAMPETGFHPAPRAGRTTWGSLGITFREAARAVRRRPVLLTILVIAAFYGLSSEGFDRLWTPHLLHDITLPALGPLRPVVWFGIISAVSSLLALVSTEVVRRRLDLRHHRAVAWTLCGMTALSVAGMVAFGLAPDLVVALGAYWVYALARGAARPVKSAWLTQQIDPEVRATVLSMSGQVDALGQIVGGPAIGAIGNASLRAAIVVAGLALAPALPLYARAAGQGRDLAPDETAVVDGEAEAVGRSPGP